MAVSTNTTTRIITTLQITSLSIESKVTALQLFLSDLFCFLKILTMFLPVKSSEKFLSLLHNQSGEEASQYTRYTHVTISKKLYTNEIENDRKPKVKLNVLTKGVSGH